MTNAGQIDLTLESGTIRVTMPGTRFAVTYRKADGPFVFASDIRSDPAAPIRLVDFLTRAWTAADRKARELGWID